MSALTDQDSVIRFLFDNHGVRGEILRMQEPCEKLILTRNYPRCIKAMLLELAAALRRKFACEIRAHQHPR